jgi:hypothetical protein
MDIWARHEDRGRVLTVVVVFVTATVPLTVGLHAIAATLIAGAMTVWTAVVPAQVVGGSFSINGDSR